ncbi:MAG: right-handed parallel beta-helix repeat-containing protein [Candidatus Tectimicrobiota bacterium]
MQTTQCTLFASLVLALLCTMPVGRVSADDDRHSIRTHHVNCDLPGHTLTKALKRAQPGDTIRVQGTCKETVTITTDRLTLLGVHNATIQGPGGPPSLDVSEGILNIVGVQGVEIRNLTIQDSPVNGISGRQGAAFVVRDTRVHQSSGTGIEVTENSTVRFLGTCEVRGSSRAGISIRRGSSALLLADLVHTIHNNWGVLVLWNSSLALTGEQTTLLTEENTTDGIIVADNSNLRLDGGLLTSQRNGSRGLALGEGNSGILGGTVLLAQNQQGLTLNDASRMAVFMAGNLTIQHNTMAGLIADNQSTLRIINGGTITDNGPQDVVLRLGSAATLSGYTCRRRRPSYWPSILLSTAAGPSSPQRHSNPLSGQLSSRATRHVLTFSLLMPQR